MKNLRVKSVFRLDEIQRHFRLFRVLWERGTVGDGNGYSIKLAIGIWARLLGYERVGGDVLLTVLGLRIHYSRSYGGIFATLALLAIVLMHPTPAFAQVDAGGIFGAWRPYLIEIVGMLVAAFVGVILELVRRWTGLSIEARHREALQTAVTNAAGLLIARAGDKLNVKTLTIGNPMLTEAVEYVLKGVPEAAAKFGLTPLKVAEMIRAKLPQIGGHA